MVRVYARVQDVRTAVSQFLVSSSYTGMYVLPVLSVLRGAALTVKNRLDGAQQLSPSCRLRTQHPES